MHFQGGYMGGNSGMGKSLDGELRKELSLGLPVIFPRTN